MDNTTGCLIGGAVAGQGNLVGGNGSDGIALGGDACEGNVISGNRVGVNLAGTVAIPNANEGIVLFGGAHNNTIGGSTAGAGNLVSGNIFNGILLASRTTANLVQGNIVGLGADGTTPLGNFEDGIGLANGASNNLIGGEGTGAANVSSANRGAGVHVNGSNTLNNTISRNSIYNNAGLGIRLSEGGNGNMGAPVISGLGSVDGTAPPDSTVEIFVDGSDEGRIYLDTVTAQNDGTFSSDEPVGAYVGMFVTATARNAAGSTSIFSVPLLISGVGEGEGEGEGRGDHSADLNKNGRIELSELLRLVQFYNSGIFHCQGGTEDGYNPGPGPQNCTTHDSDYADQDWRINLFELLRLVQFYNSNAYFECTGTEDGYCPGLG
ncbi:MAG: hypothetical protein HYZ00_06940 [Candidatus Hydrogenedentes bacterium]|nr:hypothetical protein [Candidatus Hydrogenedentota bacterium]